MGKNVIGRPSANRYPGVHAIWYAIRVMKNEAERALVNANRELIARMEKKIQATLARVWGDREPIES